MAKDPAFLFFTGDFATGTQFFTDEQVGKFVRLLMAQHQHGHLSEKQVMLICKTSDSEVMSKFKKDAQGFFFNERLEFEINRRKKFSDSRSNNRSGKYKKDLINISSSQEDHMENEIKNENKIINTIEERKKEFVEKVQNEPGFEKPLKDKFINYWTEHNEKGKKMRFEMQKVFNLKARLNTFLTNSKEFKNGNDTKKRTAPIPGAEFGKL